MTTTTAPITAPAEPTTPIRPSEALRLGRLLYPLPLAGDLTDGVHSACALGAIAAGANLIALSDRDTYANVIDRFPEMDTPGTCPERCGAYDGWFVRTLVWHLNDSHDWSDDQIVAWLQERGL